MVWDFTGWEAVHMETGGRMFGNDVFAGTSETGRCDRRASLVIPPGSCPAGVTYDDSCLLEQVPPLTPFRQCREGQRLFLGFLYHRNSPYEIVTIPKRRVLGCPTSAPLHCPDLLLLGPWSARWAAWQRVTRVAVPRRPASVTWEFWGGRKHPLLTVTVETPAVRKHTAA